MDVPSDGAAVGEDVGKVDGLEVGLVEGVIDEFVGGCGV